MKIIGVTGGIGSGKTTVCDVFASFGVPVFNADKEALSMYENDPELVIEIRNVFGPDVVKDDKVDRQALAKKVFNDSMALETLNRMIHPRVGARFSKWVEKIDFPYVIREAAILIESGSYRDCAEIIVVRSPENLRIKRVIERSGLSEDDVRKRMARQMSEGQLLAYADHVIENDGKTLILPVIALLHRQFMA